MNGRTFVLGFATGVGLLLSLNHLAKSKQQWIRQSRIVSFPYWLN